MLLSGGNSVLALTGAPAEIASPAQAAVVMLLNARPGIGADFVCARRG